MLFKFYLRQNRMGIWPVSSPSIYPMLPNKWEPDLILSQQGSDLGWIILSALSPASSTTLGGKLFSHSMLQFHGLPNDDSFANLLWTSSPPYLYKAAHFNMKESLLPQLQAACCGLGGIVTKGHCRPLRLTYFRPAIRGKMGSWVRYNERIWNDEEISLSSSRDMPFLLHPGAGMSPTVTLTQTKLNSSPHCSP